jgi:hypothetical protein
MVNNGLKKCFEKRKNRERLYYPSSKTHNTSLPFSSVRSSRLGFDKTPALGLGAWWRAGPAARRGSGRAQQRSARPTRRRAGPAALWVAGAAVLRANQEGDAATGRRSRRTDEAAHHLLRHGTDWVNLLDFILCAVGSWLFVLPPLRADPLLPQFRAALRSRNQELARG